LSDPRRLVVVALFFTVALLLRQIFIFSSSPGAGIHLIGSEAVYLAGEACTINAGLERSVKDLRTDFEECAAFHAHYQLNEGAP
jgi:hypothetical protein